MNKQEIKGKAKSRRGRVNEVKGVLTENHKLERHGATQRVEGSIDTILGGIRRQIGESIERLGASIKA